MTGLNDVTWDGKLDDGTVAADGDYTSARRGQGQQPATP